MIDEIRRGLAVLCLFHPLQIRSIQIPMWRWEEISTMLLRLVGPIPLLDSAMALKNLVAG